MKTLGVIPARYGSTRLPGKMLCEIEGKPLLWWTWNAAKEAKQLDKLVIASGDQNISDAATNFGADVIDVFDDVPSGSDRVYEAAKKVMSKGEMYPLVVNIQGDEPMLKPDIVDSMVLRMKNDSSIGVGTPITELWTQREYETPSVVKVVLDDFDNAIYFSRSPIPNGWNEDLSGNNWKHIGLYAYRFEVLDAFVKHRTGPLEVMERLEQLRFLEMGVKIGIVKVKHSGLAVDTQMDLDAVKKMMREKN